MKKRILTVLTLILIASYTPVFAMITPEDYSTVIKSTKELYKLSNKGKADKIAGYYSDKYKSFDGFNKEEALRIYEIAYGLYPDSKSKEKIKKIETKDNKIIVYIDEISKTKTDASGLMAVLASEKIKKGEMVSSSSYSVTYAKENGLWKIVADEIFAETTEIRHGEAKKTDFKMETPKNLVPEEEFTTKISLKLPENRCAIGSIGHDRIVIPPGKTENPYRMLDYTDTLERVMTANKEGKNEYVDSTYFISLTPAEAAKKNKKIRSHVVTGMGIYIQRVNMHENL